MRVGKYYRTSGAANIVYGPVYCLAFPTFFKILIFIADVCSFLGVSLGDLQIL